MAKKLYYKIGEACKQLDIQPYVLRYWETEFPLLAPSKSTSGQRVYSDQDLRVIQRIKELLYDEGYTIAGAKKKLEKGDLSSLAAVRELPTAPEGDGEKAIPEEASKAKPATRSKPAPKGDGGRKAKTKAAVAGGDAAERKLRRGLREALKEARGLLEFLDSQPDSRYSTRRSVRGAVL